MSTVPQLFEPDRYYRLPAIIRGKQSGDGAWVLPIGETTWFAGIRDGRYPKGVLLAPNCRAWLGAELNEALAKLAETGDLTRKCGRPRTREPAPEPRRGRGRPAMRQASQAEA